MAAAPAAAACAVPEQAGVAARQVIAALNARRAAAGLPAVGEDRRLARAARDHACDMVGRGYFGHRAPNGARLTDRLARVGYRNCAGAENLALGQRSAGQVMRDWMDSPGHRRNALDRNLRRAGAAVVAPQGGGPLHWVLVMGKPC